MRKRSAATTKEASAGHRRNKGPAAAPTATEKAPRQRRRPAQDAAEGPMQSETAEVISMIGARLRALRLARGMTLNAVAARTGLSSSMLSLLERGKTGPSIGTLVVICSVLEAQMSDLLGAQEAGEPSPIARFAEQRVFATADGVQRRILKSDPAHGIEIAINEYSAGTASAPHPVAHEGYEFGIALEGMLEITLNNQIYTLGEGDLVAYRSGDPHRIANPSRKRARALWVNLRKE